MGGIVGPEEAIEFLIAGASAVAVGTANFIDPTTPLRVLEGIEAYLRRHGMNAVAALTGSLCMTNPATNHAATLDSDHSVQVEP